MSPRSPKPPTSREQAEKRLQQKKARAKKIQESQQRTKPTTSPARSPKPKPSSLSNNIYIEHDTKSLVSNKPVDDDSSKLLADDSQNLIDDLEGLNDSQLEEKRPLTEKEKKFLALYFNSGKIDAAVKAAGYKSRHQQSRSLIGNRILKKYCEAVGDARNILRDLGASEAALLMLLWEKAKNARSEQVQVAAMKVLAQAFKMLGEGLELPKGASMRFYFEGQAGPDESQEPYSREQGGQEEAAEPVTIIK